MKIGIIGVGPAGSNILKHIINHKNFSKDIEIHLFETRSKLGRGLPYDEDNLSKMLNIKAEKMSLNPKDKYDFTDWLDENKDNPYGKEEMVPRPIYGEYIIDFYKKYYKNAQVKIFKLTVEDIEIIDASGKITYKIRDLRGWRDDEYDALFFTLGHPMYNDFYDLDGIKNYIHNPYPIDTKLAYIRPDQDVAIIGSGATGIDLFRYFSSQIKLQKPLKILLRNKAFKLPKIEYKGKKIKPSIDQSWIDKNTDSFSLDKVISTIKEDFEVMNIDFSRVYEEYKDESIDDLRKTISEYDNDLAYIIEYFEILTPLYPFIYGKFSEAEKEIFLDEYDQKLELFRTLTPPKTIEWILSEIDKGNLELIFGLDDIKKSENGFFIKADKELNVDVLVNATGFNFSLEENAKKNILLNNLIKRQITQVANEGNYIKAVWPSCQIDSPKYGILNKAFVIGMWASDIHYRPNDIRSILSVTKNVADLFMNEISK